jgi:glucosylceramidase
LVSSGSVSVWLTTPDQKNLVSPQASVAWTENASGQRTINIDDARRYQEIDGFGANYSDLTTYLMTYRMTEAQRSALLQTLFSAKDGAGFNMIRVAIGANDQVFDQRYNDRASTYADNDGVADYALDSFSIRHDMPYIIPRLRDAMAVNPGLKILATAWWQPSWLVVPDSKSCAGRENGRPFVTVDPKHYDVYANLFVKYVQAYSAEGVNLWAVSPQNEPNCSGGAQQNMVLSASGQNAFIRDYLDPALHASNLGVGIVPDVDNYCYGNAYTNTLLNDPSTSKKILGPAWHGYCDGKGSKIATMYPATPHYMSEVGYGAPYKWVNLTGSNGGSAEVIAELRNYAKAYLWHAMANDRDGSLSNCPGKFCGSLIRIDQTSGEVSYDMPFYVLEHFSKFARPGSVRIDSNQDGPIQNVAFKNADGSFVLVAANTHASKSQSVSVNWHGHAISFNVPANSIATFTWEGE